MYKVSIIAFCYLAFNSCSSNIFNSGDELIGNWYYGRQGFIKIDKAGEYYHIYRCEKVKWDTINETVTLSCEDGQSQKDYCLYEKGCFILRDSKIIVACENYEQNGRQGGVRHLIYQGGHYWGNPPSHFNDVMNEAFKDVK
jgi:hypothetical protein